ncbi:MAG TPA: hypothetical protein VFP52_00915 [Myxococcales bacterium]|nr:hypothetical protein [Myxococcales bacterium]
MKRHTSLLACAALLAGCHGSTPCKTVRDCANTQRCENGSCAEIGSTPGKIGESCRTSGDCSSGLICNSSEVGFPGGYCTADCSANTCSVGACTTVGTTDLCVAQCTDDSACRKGYACCATMNNVCVPAGACTPAACSRLPVTSALAGSISGSQVIELGTHKVGETLPFTVPPGTGSVTIVHQADIASLTVNLNGQDIDNSAVPLFVHMPDGGVAYDDNPQPPISGSADAGVQYAKDYSFFGGGTPSTAAFTFPNTTASLDAGVPAGTWNFTVNDFASECLTTPRCTGGTDANTYQMSVLLRPLPPGSNLDVAFYIVADMNTLSGQPFTAANAPGDPSVQQMLRTYKGLMGNSGSGINVRNVSFFDVTAADRARFGTNISATDTGPCSDLNQMFVLSGAHPGNTVNIFLAQSLRFSAQGGGTIVGIDGTIPGPSTLNGTVHSGAVVSAADLFAPSLQNCATGGFSIGGCGPDRVAYIAAHETGHFLGLFHTTEQNGSDFDPLADTGTCACVPCAGADQAACANDPGPNAPFLAADQCFQTGTGAVCTGGDNLMFWQLEPGVSRGTISPQQAQVMRLNPAVVP